VGKTRNGLPIWIGVFEVEENSWMATVCNGYAERGLYEYGRTESQALDKLKETISSKHKYKNHAFIILRE